MSGSRTLSELLKPMVSSDVGSHENGIAKEQGIAASLDRDMECSVTRIFWSCQIVSVVE